jgi:flavin reductase (DIM6/NTAB) family NADH-FMN oxidoreductase RutF
MSEFAPALGRIPSGLFIVTLHGPDAEVAMLASWVQQCSFDPPLVSVAIKSGRDVATWLPKGAPFGVNVVAEGQSGIVSYFAQGRRLNDPSFDQACVERSAGRPPILTNALAVLFCRVVDQFATGDHQLVIAQVEDGALQGEGRPWVHVRKNGLNY